MLHGTGIIITAFVYLGLLFAIAYYADERADAGRSVIASPYIYSLSLAVYATAWTFYGSVGRAASDGVGFLPIYIGPTLMIALWWIVMRKILRISKQNRITSLADFIASRYGKSALLGGLVTVIAIIGILPYISLQLKAVSNSFTILVQYPEIIMPTRVDAAPIREDTALWVAMILAAFTIAFGTRHLDAAEHHQGMVAAIAFESLVKLLAFLAVGVFVTFGIYNGFGDLFARAAAEPKLRAMMTPIEGVAGGYASWVWLTILSMMAIMFLPRQFQVAVIENVDEKHLSKAIWLFPLYMLAINVFVLPIAFGGRLHFPDGSVDADTFVLTLPMAEKQELLALLVFIGGLSAATGMVIVETIALSTMACNDLVMPVLLRLSSLRLNERRDLTGLLLGIRRGAIVLILLLGYLYFKLAGEAYALVSIGLISFAAVAQFAPPILGGIFWKGGTRLGALSGLTAGFAVWSYTLLLPALARSGWLPISLLEAGPFGIELLRPLQLFGLSGLDQITHAMIWSMIANIGAYVAVSLSVSQSADEHRQASLFVDVFKQTGETGGARFWRGTASVPDLYNLLARFFGVASADSAFAEYTSARGLGWPDDRLVADAELVHYVEVQLAGAIGAASARVMVASVVKEEALTIAEVREILDEASQVVVYSHRLEQKSRELEAATTELREANERLKELDRLKDDFVSTVTHELRTPLTSIRAFTEILLDEPDVEPAQRKKFLGIITKEAERLTRLINQVLDLAKIESGKADWVESGVDMKEVISDTLAAMGQLFKEKNIKVEARLPEKVSAVTADLDRMIQVMLNLLSNAVKFCDSTNGWVEITLAERDGSLRIDVRDNGRGIRPEDHEAIFSKFHQVGDTLTDKPHGSGLGLHISRKIVEHFGGKMWVESNLGSGARFSFTLPTGART
ncbi:MAG TPA: sensor histidine kinase [Casimicrobiaceae bacterium]|jgi:Na+/proline symporter/nitrogen-specific signal transduction histidine kinase|nr:sensor histidine kinase [Casimicrobiaceae bacterium]